MEQYLDVFADNPLFAHIDREDLIELLCCLQAQKRGYKKGAFMFHADQKITLLGIVLSGTVRTESTDVLGERSIISFMGPGQLFCDAYSSTDAQVLLVDVIAQTDCIVMLIETRRLFLECSGTQKYRARLNENLIHILARKYVDLGCKVIHLSGRTTRRKLLSYLSEQFRFSQGKPFSIPFNQQELADYLFVERSGLSTELNKLKKEGILVSSDGLYSLKAPDLE